MIDLDQNGTTGGGAAGPIDATSFSQLAALLAGDAPRVVRLTTSVTGSVEIGSNKTLDAAKGAVLRGHLELDGSANVIVRNLSIVTTPRPQHVCPAPPQAWQTAPPASPTLTPTHELEVQFLPGQHASPTRC
jgi:pectate lyase